MNLGVELTEKDIKQLIKSYLETQLNREIDDSEISIEVKSKQNYKSEWESAQFRATYKSYKL